MSTESFKERFSRLMTEMKDLVKEAPKDELEQLKINILDTNSPSNSEVYCHSEKEFLNRLMEYITGKRGTFPYILQHHDELTDSDIQQHQQTALLENRYFILPTEVTPISNRNLDQFTPYLVFETHDKKLFLYPLIGECFSDTYNEFIDNMIDNMPED